MITYARSFTKIALIFILVVGIAAAEDIPESPIEVLRPLPERPIIAHPITILRCDKPRWDDLNAMETMFERDKSDMDVRRGRGANPERIREEVRLFAQIQKDFGYCNKPL